MKVRDILKLQCTAKANCSSTTNQDITVYQSFRLISKYESKLKLAQSLEYHCPIQDQMKKEVPFIYYSGTYPDGCIQDNAVLTYTNLMTIDIDLKDNPDVDLKQIMTSIFKLPYVVGYYTSFSGRGYWCLVLVEDGSKIPSYYEYIKRLWKREFNVDVDSKTHNIARARALSWNPDWISTTKDLDADIIPWKLQYIHPTPTPTVSQPQVYRAWKSSSNSSYNAYDPLEYTHKCIQECSKRGTYTGTSYASWIRLAGECKNFSDGYELFRAFSINNPNCQDTEDRMRQVYDAAKVSQIDDTLHRKWQGTYKKIKADQTSKTH